MFVNLTMVHKPFHGTPQIKGQYALLYLKWLDQNLPLEKFLNVKRTNCAFSFVFFFVFVFFLFFWCLVLGFFGFFFFFFFFFLDL